MMVQVKAQVKKKVEKNNAAIWLRLLLCLLLFSPMITPLTAGAEEKRKPVTLEGKSLLPLRVLSRAFSTIYTSADKSGSTVEENVPAFQAFFVYGKKMAASDLEEFDWYEVGTDNRGTVVGWMTSEDVFEWKQTMCLSYTHPQGRHPVLMFDNKDVIEAVVLLPDELRKKEINKIYQDIEDGNIPPDFSVITVEPKMAVDIAKEFYLLPILDFAAIEINNREARLLKLAAVTRGSEKARVSSDIRKNKEYLQAASLDSQAAVASKAKDLAVDIVWVMDTTNSMQPYIDETLKVMEEASKTITANPELKDAVRFGVWGYRDSMDIAGIGYTVKNYTPQLQDVATFIPTLQTVDVTPSGSKGYAEDVFAGVKGALDQTAWTEGAIKMVILVGDAPSHGSGHKWNSTKQNQETLRSLANDRHVTIFTIHIKDPKAGKYHGTAEEQFMTLSLNSGLGGNSSYFATSSQDLPGFSRATNEVTGVVVSMLEQARAAAQPRPVAKIDGAKTEGTKTDQPTAAPEAAAYVNLDLMEEDVAAPAEGKQQSAEELAKAAMKAALVQWLGSQSGAQAPRDVVAWVTDKDLLDTDIQALEVRLLLNKQQLDSLRVTLNTILMAGRTGQISGDDFFSSLQAAAVTTARDPEMIGRSKSLAQTGLVPEFLEGLPYTSRIMDMNNELWNSWSIDEQDMFLADLEARIMAYEIIHDSPAGWVQLNKSDDPGEFVYPITLELLP